MLPSARRPWWPRAITCSSYGAAGRLLQAVPRLAGTEVRRTSTHARTQPRPWRITGHGKSALLHPGFPISTRNEASRPSLRCYQSYVHGTWLSISTSEPGIGPLCRPVVLCNPQNPSSIGAGHALHPGGGDTTPYLFHLAECAFSSASSRVVGITRLPASE